jgi:hypothetical protein
MIYQAYQAYADLAVPVRTMASLGALMLRVPLFGPLDAAVDVMGDGRP